MRLPIFLRAVVFVVAGIGLSSQAALLVTGQNPSSPYYSDFTSTSLGISYVYSGTANSGTGTFTATNSGSKEAYIDHSLSPGTKGAYSTETPFTGSYVLSVTIQNEGGGNFEVTGGTITVDGNLFFPGNNSHTTDVLLTANLKTGVNTVGFGNSGTKEFDFLFTVSGGNSQIVEDFFGVNHGQGAVIIQAGAYNPVDPYTSLAASFNNTGAGTADTFVPEPAAYAWAASAAAFLGIAFVRRQSREEHGSLRTSA